MIIFGSRETYIGTARLRNGTCPACGQMDVLVVNMYCEYFHLFWIPMFPFRRRALAECRNCEHAIENRYMEGDVRDDYKEAKRSNRIPLWQFSGTVLLVLIIAQSIYSAQREKNRELDYISNPMAGDVVEYKTEDKEYSTFRIIQVTTDSLLVLFNDYVTTLSSGIPEIDVDSCYGQEYYYISRKDMEQMYNEYVIYDINRD
jgi:hypothetical protein